MQAEVAVLLNHIERELQLPAQVVPDALMRKRTGHRQLDLDEVVLRHGEEGVTALSPRTGEKDT